MTMGVNKSPHAKLCIHVCTYTITALSDCILVLLLRHVSVVAIYRTRKFSKVVCGVPSITLLHYDYGPVSRSI